MYKTHNWTFYNPVKVFFGVGCRYELTQIFSDKRLLVVCSKRGRSQFEQDLLLSKLVQKNHVLWVDSVTENPGLTYLQKEKDSLFDQSIDAVIGFGGGSALDTAKVLAVSLSADCKNLSIAELITQTLLLNETKSIPLYTMPTTSGTGSEVTPFATVWNHETKKKLSLGGTTVFAQTAFIDPELTYSLPIHATISTGLDAINQAAESFWNKNANPITFGYSTKALQLGFDALLCLAKNIEDKKSRVHLAEASLLAGLAISHTRTALCHSISYPITAHFGVSHGIACAFSMPAVLEHNLQFDDGRFELLADSLVSCKSKEGLLNKFKKLNQELDVLNNVKNKISSMDALKSILNEMNTPSRANNNLIKITEEVLMDIIERSYYYDS